MALDQRVKKITVFEKGNKSWPLISIVTPSYNQDEFIEETIRSVLLQGYPNIEYLIIDGKSTDRSVEVIKKYEKWMTFWISEKDSGQSEAINKGWQRSSGEILAWINSDDKYEPNAFRKIAQFFNDHNNTDMVYGDCRIIDRHGNFRKLAPTEEFSLRLLVNNKWFIPQQSTFIRRAVFESIGKLDENLHLVMDWDYWLRVALNGFTIKYFPEVLSNFRIYENAKTSSQGIRSGREKIRVLKSIYKDKRFAQIIEPFKDNSYSYVHLWTGKKYCMNKQKIRALTNFMLSSTYTPYLLRQKSFAKLILDCLKGKVKV